MKDFIELYEYEKANSGNKWGLIPSTNINTVTIWTIKLNDPWYKKIWIKLKFRFKAKSGDMLLTRGFTIGDKDTKL